ncbi:hypothetical protein JXA59_01320 [Patescibacteria group bacterium]|nr:hypothetical protein [Patescibacteria group bacterium]
MKFAMRWRQTIGLLLTIALVMGWSSWAPPKFDNVPQAQAAQVAINSDLFATSQHYSPSPRVVFTTDLIGYAFYIDETGDEPRYKKTTDGGASWGNEVDLGDDENWAAIAVWYDQWTPGDTTGTYIYIVAHEASGTNDDDLYFKKLDTSTGTLTPTGTTWTKIGDGTANYVAATNGPVSITKSTEGNLFAVSACTGTLDVYKSVNSGANWSATSSGLDSATDYNQLLPIGISGGGVLLLNQDVSGNDMRTAVYDEDSNSWTSALTIRLNNTMIESTTNSYEAEFGAAVNKLTGQVYFVGNNYPTNSGADIVCAVVSYDGTSTVTWTDRTNVYTNIGTAGLHATVAIDQHNGDLYAFYLRGTVGSAMAVYYKKSANQGGSWGSESSAVSSSTGNYQGIYANITSLHKIHVAWNDVTNLGMLAVNYTDTTALNIADVRMMLFYDGALVPAGWTGVADTAYDIFYQKFVRGSDAYSAGADGSATHSHTITWVSSVGNVPMTTITDSGSDGSTTTHEHNSLGSSSMDADTSLPSYREIQVISCDAGTTCTVPDDGIAIFDTSPTSGTWTRYSAQDDKFIRCGPYAVSPPTGGSATHTHTNVAITTGGPSATEGLAGAPVGESASASHTHSGSSTTAAGDHTPVNVDILLYQNTAGDAQSVPGGMVGMFTGAPGDGWDAISDSGETFYQKFMEAKDAYTASGGGNATHTHSNLAIVTGNPSALINIDMPMGEPVEVPFDDSRGEQHTHIITVSFGKANNLPPYIDVIIGKKDADPVYSPATRNWRWYADEDDEAVGTPYAAENTAPPQDEMGNSTRLKLRINISNTDGVEENDSRKKLQYTTDAAGWLDVSFTTDTASEWRYYNGGGDDNGVLSAVVLTDSDSTDKGIHNESSSDSPSNSDHPADKVVEFEYCIEAYKATATAEYTFRLYDQVLAAAISPEDGEVNPSLRMGTFALTVSSPSAVFLGTWDLGSGGYHSYTFVGGEEITNRDNRGLGGGGDSGGWTCSVEVTSLLNNGTYDIDSANMYWISYTTDIMPLYDAPTTGMSGNAGEAMGSAVTVITVSGSGYQGLGGFTMLPTVRIYNTPATGDYTGGVLTLTTI